MVVTRRGSRRERGQAIWQRPAMRVDVPRASGARRQRRVSGQALAHERYGRIPPSRHPFLARAHAHHKKGSDNL